MDPDQFWNYTLYELRLKHKGFMKLRESDREQLMIQAWYNGYFTKIDLSKYTLDKWVMDLKPQEERDRIKREEFNKMGELWDSQNR